MEAPILILVLAAAAGVAAAAALLMGDPLRLRALMLAALALAGAALALAAPPGPPLAAGLAALALTALGALAGALLAAWERSPLSVPRSTRHVLLSLGRVEPRLFRALMSAGALRTAEIPLRLTRQGHAPEHLWFLVSGTARIEKNGDRAELRGPVFLGEISWLTGGAATATVVLEPDSEFVEWDHRDLRRVCDRTPRLRMVLESLIACDLAHKVARGRPPEELAQARSA